MSSRIRYTFLRVELTLSIAPGPGANIPIRFSTVPVHRIVLASVSPYFDALFSSAPIGWEPVTQTSTYQDVHASTNLIPFPSFQADPSLHAPVGVWPLAVEDEEALRLVLEWFYFGDSVELSLRSCWMVLVLARELEIPSLERRVVSWVEMQVTRPSAGGEAEWFGFLAGAARAGAGPNTIAAVLAVAADASLRRDGRAAGRDRAGEFEKFKFLHRLVSHQRMINDALDPVDVQRLFSCVSFGSFSMDELEAAYADPVLPREVIAEALMMSLKQRAESTSSSISSARISAPPSASASITIASPARRMEEDVCGAGDMSTASWGTAVEERGPESETASPRREMKPWRSSTQKSAHALNEFEGDDWLGSYFGGDCNDKSRRPAVSDRAESAGSDTTLIDNAFLPLRAYLPRRSIDSYRSYHRDDSSDTPVEEPQREHYPDDPTPDPTPCNDDEDGDRHAVRAAFEDMSFSDANLTFSNPQPMLELAEVRRQLDELMKRKAEQQYLQEEEQDRQRQRNLQEQGRDRERQRDIHEHQQRQAQQQSEERRASQTGAGAHVDTTVARVCPDYNGRPRTPDVLGAVRRKLEGIASTDSHHRASPTAGSYPSDADNGTANASNDRRDLEPDPSTAQRGRPRSVVANRSMPRVLAAAGVGFIDPKTNALDDEFVPEDEVPTDVSNRDDPTPDLLARLRLITVSRDRDAADGREMEGYDQVLELALDDMVMVETGSEFGGGSGEAEDDDDWEGARRSDRTGHTAKGGEKRSTNHMHRVRTVKVASSAVHRGPTRQLKRPPGETAEPAASGLHERRRPATLYHRRGASLSDTPDVGVRRITPPNPLPPTPAAANSKKSQRVSSGGPHGLHPVTPGQLLGISLSTERLSTSPPPADTHESRSLGPATGIPLPIMTEPPPRLKDKDMDRKRAPPAWKSSSSTLGDDGDGAATPISCAARTPPVAYRHSLMPGTRTWGPSSVTFVDPELTVASDATPAQGTGTFRMVGLKHASYIPGELSVGPFLTEHKEPAKKRKGIIDFFKGGFHA
ncbi:hypothetical protein BDK51DRAFT_42765 [Blyttiomyces helicus]|uniref:BTB domain-containing protein n=1 Tax=Blyttiomyces helicus TaxID=388810 RepID=A0A4P9WIJ0_9FUNG|nr:hypothetical protein BDK51DRAFT_42765 [Blyttiomyces helicus]|eukprot:RKO91825.1 hypothetical protein BDK51DRAFT_42765 [Blyttiomyces helicus]